LAAAGFSAGDVSGEWTAEVQARGGRSAEIAMDLKGEDGTVTGTVRAAHGEASISSGIIDGDRISFSVVTDFDGHHFTQHYKGIVEGDIIHFSLTVEEGGSETSPIRDFDARRVN
jgi:hypothetical protein